MARNLYGPRVRMGNWNEDVYLEEMQLSVSEDGYVHYGDKVMLVNPDHPEIEAHLFLGGDLSLCMTPDEMQVHLSDDLEVPCGLSASQTKIPEVYLTDEDSYLNCWQAAFPDPQLRLEYEGFPIPDVSLCGELLWTKETDQGITGLLCMVFMCSGLVTKGQLKGTLVAEEWREWVALRMLAFL
ncbi:hypothetical protein CB1_001254008 [Camelus ferus]|nr:hypothetical protein CB1_001254008 [Camelus ferus]